MFGVKRREEKATRDILISSFSPKSSLVEAYRTLRTNLEHAASFSGAKLFLIASACPREGKSLSACNTAIIMSERERPVLLVDADMRRSMVHSYFELNRSPGLSDVLTGSVRWRDVIRSVGIPHLSVITGGNIPRNPAQLISSVAMQEFIKEVRAAFDFIILDSAAILPTTDASILGPMTDAVLLVLRAQVTKREAIQRAHTVLKNVGASVIGCLLNGISRRRLSYYYYYYQYYGK